MSIAVFHLFPPVTIYYSPFQLPFTIHVLYIIGSRSRGRHCCAEPFPLLYYSPFTSHHSPFTSHHSPFTSHHSPFTIHQSPFTFFPFWTALSLPAFAGDSPYAGGVSTQGGFAKPPHEPVSAKLAYSKLRTLPPPQDFGRHRPTRTALQQNHIWTPSGDFR